MILKRIVAAVAICIAMICLCSAGVENKFVQRQRSDGWLFFIFSQKMPAVKGNALAKNIDYDYTFLESTDSVTLLATLRTDVACKPTYSAIEFCDTSYTTPVELIYALPKGKGFVYRIKTVIPFEIWYKMYQCSNPFVLTYGFPGNGTASLECKFGYTSGKWKSNRDNIARIIEAVRFNTGKE